MTLWLLVIECDNGGGVSPMVLSIWSSRERAERARDSYVSANQPLVVYQNPWVTATEIDSEVEY